MDERPSGNGPNGPQNGSGVLHAPEVPDRGGAQARPGSDNQITTGAPAPSAGGQQGHRGNQFGGEFGAAGIIGGSGEQIQPKGGGYPGARPARIGAANGGGIDEKPIIKGYEPEGGERQQITATSVSIGNLPGAAVGGTMAVGCSGFGGTLPAFPQALDERGYGVGTSSSSAIGGKERDQR